MTKLFQRKLDDEVRLLRKPLTVEWADYVYSLADWKNFVTLTSKNEIGRDGLSQYFRSLIQYLNTKLYGHHYTRIVKHCYFSYVICYERQDRGVYHAHFLADDYLDYKAIHDFWNKACGFAWCVPVYDRIGVSNYVSKYVSKEGDLEVYLNKNKKLPSFVPYWYLIAGQK